jgi:hypothetical protein
MANGARPFGEPAGAQTGKQGGADACFFGGALIFRALLIMSAFAFAAGSALRAEVQLPPDAAACVRWAAGDVDAELAAAHLHPSDAMVRVRIRDGGTGLPDSISIDEQTFSLAVHNGAVEIDAGGAVGAMYGLEELAEQIRNRAGKAVMWRALTARLTSTAQRPWLEIRADNMFIHTQGTSEPPPPDGYPLLVNDLPMWRAYIDMLARDRFNLLDLHGAYDLESTSFPNLYPMLVHVPEYPAVGNQSVQRRNLESLRAIVDYARSRGVRVALMNYSANNGYGGPYKSQVSVTGVAPEKLADYTAKAVALLIRQLPGLYMLGFRVGESSQPASFYRDAYLRGIEEAGRQNLHIYTRSWQTTKAQLTPIAEAARGDLTIEIKFNGEQLGLPYQALQGPAYGSYSYQDYLDVPADYRILWQIRANGTHRYWSWENTAFIRRAVRSCRLGNALGFTLEPHVAYFSVYSDQYYRAAQDVAVYKYTWQKHWMWYYAWGRLGYNPDLAESNLIDEFTSRFGEAGKTIYAAMQQGGTIVPLIYAYRFVGPDQRDFSPETETGEFDAKKKRARQDLLQFAENTPEDGRNFVGIEQYVSERIAGTPDGRTGPFAVARQLTDAAAETRLLAGSVPALQDQAAGQWRLLRADLLSASYLGDYYAARIRGMAYLEFALHTGNAADYKTALASLARSRQAWTQLSGVADSIYRPLANPLRSQKDFQWSSQIAPLERIDATAADFWQKHANEISRLPLESGTSGADAFGNVSLTYRAGGNSAVIACSASRNGAIVAATLWWKPLPSELAWQSAPMRRAMGGNGTLRWQATAPLDAHGMMYMVELRSADGDVQNFPNERQQTPWGVIPPFASASK